MVYQKYGPESSHEERSLHRLHIMYTGKMRERQVFMEELKEYRKRIAKQRINSIIKSIGPIWYQALSVPQRTALDALDFSIYQDLLEGRPIRTGRLMVELGIYPRPSNLELMNCLYLGKDDPKEMLAQLYYATYGHTIDGKCSSYPLNAKLILTGILYLGLNNLIELLKERFRPDQPKAQAKPKPKPKPEPPLESPYLQKMIAVLYLPPQKKKFVPAPLPNLDELNEPYEEDPPLPRPPPPPPPPPPPKKRLPKAYCDKLAGVMTIEPYNSLTSVTMKTVHRASHRKVRGSKLCLTEMKKSYGISVTGRQKSARRRKPVAPSTGMKNSQYTINGVFEIHGKKVFVLGNVSVLPAEGDLIHGGYRMLNGDFINIHCGFRGRPPPPKPDPCDCVKKWQDKIFDYVKSSKCYCGHYYDYGNEGTFPPDELPFFQKPTKMMSFQMNYQTIYDIDEKRLQVEKDFKRLWDTDSVLHVDDGTVKEKKDKKKKLKRSSATCLGQNPKPEDYLKCALRLMRRVNVAARLPDVHLVPELREWMRYRIYGPYKDHQKAEMLRKSTTYWQMFHFMENKGYGHVSVPKDPIYSGHTTWVHKQSLNDKFRKFTFQYRLSLYRSLAYINNLLWATMYQAEFPDKKFREIYYSYLSARVEDLLLMHPYSTTETTERKMTIAKKRYCCIPAGIDPEK